MDKAKQLLRRKRRRRMAVVAAVLAGVFFATLDWTMGEKDPLGRVDLTIPDKNSPFEPESSSKKQLDTDPMVK